MHQRGSTAAHSPFPAGIFAPIFVAKYKHNALRIQLVKKICEMRLKPKK
jgi:hypothetical protein